MSPDQPRSRPSRAVYRRRQAVAGGAVLAVIVLVIVAVTSLGSSSKNAAPTTTTSTTAMPSSQHHHGASATFAGPNGIEASWVIAENKRPGSTAWKIPASMDPSGIQGFASLDAAAPGQSVRFYVSTPAPTYHAVAYRMGYYGGDGAREVWSSGTMAGEVQPTCPLTSGINMVTCENWTTSFSVAITDKFVQGDYLFELIGSGGQKSYVPLTVIDPVSHAAYMVVGRTFTEEGWNTYGGYSFYQGEGACAAGVPSYPVCNRARVLSYDRPQAIGNGASDFLGNEYPLIEYMEAKGLDVTYVTDTLLEEDPSLALNHRAWLSLGHDETWSYNERQAATEARAHGVNLVFFGAAAVLRHVRLEPSSIGPDREEVNYRDSEEDPLNATGPADQVTGNTFDSPPTNLPPSLLTGQLYSGYLNVGASVPMVVTDPTAWIYDGTGLKQGDQLPGVIQSDIDHVSPSTPTPGDIQVFAHSPVPTSLIYTNQGTWGGFTYSDFTYYTTSTSKAGVIDTGTVNWIPAMTPCSTPGSSCPAPLIRAITGNILRVFGQGPAGDRYPSVSNLATIQPQGS